MFSISTPPAIYKRSDDNRHKRSLCFLFLSGHWEVETSRTSRRVASPCSCLPAVREELAVNKREGHQHGGVIHSVTSSLMSHSESVHAKIPRLISREVWTASGNLANTLFSYMQQFGYLNTWLCFVTMCFRERGADTGECLWKAAVYTGRQAAHQ